MGRVLIIEDDVNLGRLLVECLSEHSVSLTSRIGDARNRMLAENFETVLLDLELPDGNGMKFFEEMCAHPAWALLPTIVMTGRMNHADKLKALSLGADDFLTKPVDLDELNARIAGKTRRFRIRQLEQRIVRIGNLSLDQSSLVATLQIGEVEKKIEMTSFSFRILTFFAQHEGQVLSRDYLLKNLWGNNFHISDRTIDAHICKIRKKILETGYTIQSIYGHGYVLRRRSPALAPRQVEAPSPRQ